ncbi:hypothetical protein GCM10022245_73900 [Streptomyces mayteni]
MIRSLPGSVLVAARSRAAPSDHDLRRGGSLGGTGAGGVDADAETAAADAVDTDDGRGADGAGGAIGGCVTFMGPPPHDFRHGPRREVCRQPEATRQPLPGSCFVIAIFGTAGYCPLLTRRAAARFPTEGRNP